MRIEVTQADIDAGLRNHSKKCPVGLALTRATGLKWTVGGNIAMLSMPTYDVVLLPAEVHTFVDSYDKYPSFKPEPFSFELNWGPHA